MDRLFVDVDHLMKGILKGAPQSAMELSPERYIRIRKRVVSIDVLLSIKPKFAESIISGRKKYEFRKNSFTKKDIGRVYIYSTTPIKKIVGNFRINKIIEDKPSTLWYQLKDDAGVSEEEFFDYFKNREVGFAYEIVEVEKFECPVDPKIIFPNFVPPQSFCYINFSFMPDG